MTTAEAAAVDPKALKTFPEFYAYYLTEHSHPICRRMHFAGMTLGLACLAVLLFTGKLQFLLYGLLCGYGFAWLGHFLFEKNRPATFKRPLYSFMGDCVMYKDMWTGKVSFS